MDLEKLTEADKKMYQLAAKHSLANEHAEVAVILTKLVESYPSLSILRGSLANSLWEINEFDRAIHEFRTAILYSPDLEILSLGLFHCLWDLGRVDDAFSEMNRFLSEHESEDYRKILDDINEKSRQDSK